MDFRFSGNNEIIECAYNYLRCTVVGPGADFSTKSEVVSRIPRQIAALSKLKMLRTLIFSNMPVRAGLLQQNLKEKSKIFLSISHSRI